jgi:hypothetical protein
MVGPGLRALTHLLVAYICLTPTAAGAQHSVLDGTRVLLNGAVTDSQIDSVAPILALQVATFPVGTSSGAFTWERDRETGEYYLRASTLGPLFAERAGTLGVQGAVTFSVNTQSTRFTSFEGQGLRNGDLRIRAALGGQLVDLYRFTADMSVRATSIVATYGAESNIDVGVVLPFVNTTLNGTAVATTPTGLSTNRIVDVSSASLGDVAIRGKWHFLPTRDGGLAAGLEVSLPTGSREGLSTAGNVRVKPSLIMSTSLCPASGSVRGCFSPHVTVGYSFGGSGTSTDGPEGAPRLGREAGREMSYAVGAEVAPHEAITVFVDVLGRSYFDVARWVDSQELRDLPLVGPTLVDGFGLRRGTLHTRLGALGARVLLGEQAMLSLALIVPLSDGGLRPEITPVVGFEYAFGERGR